MGSVTNTAFHVEETAGQLDQSLRTLEMGLALVPEEWQRRPPRKDAWSVATNLAHMAIYEELLAAPVLEALAAGADGTGAAPSSDEGWFARETEALSREPLDHMLDRLRAARRRQIVAVRSFTDEGFNTPLTPLWVWSGRGNVPLDPPAWVATKTVQHTWEHGNSILQIALFAPR
jgi:hypothetical protein